MRARDPMVRDASLRDAPHHEDRTLFTMRIAAIDLILKVWFKKKLSDFSRL
jgi:hypothetical protein